MADRRAPRIFRGTLALLLALIATASAGDFGEADLYLSKVEQRIMAA